jgi:hypothetical protein
MKIVNEVNQELVWRACNLVQTHHKDLDFRHNIESSVFTNIPEGGQHIVSGVLLNFSGMIYVKPYKTWNPWSKTIGYSTGNKIYVNMRKIHLPIKDRVENIMHECFHQMGFSHKGNYVTAYNLQTVPYKGAAMFVKYLETIGKL